MKTVRICDIQWEYLISYYYIVYCLIMVQLTQSLLPTVCVPYVELVQLTTESLSLFPQCLCTSLQHTSPWQPVSYCVRAPHLTSWDSIVKWNKKKKKSVHEDEGALQGVGRFLKQEFWDGACSLASQEPLCFPGCAAHVIWSREVTYTWKHWAAKRLCCSLKIEQTEKGRENSEATVPSPLRL